eukprot:s379_g45.t1
MTWRKVDQVQGVVKPTRDYLMDFKDVLAKNGVLDKFKALRRINLVDSKAAMEVNGVMDKFVALRRNKLGELQGRDGGERGPGQVRGPEGELPPAKVRRSEDAGHDELERALEKTMVQPAKTPAEAAEQLRQWQRQLRRSREFGVQPPDPLLLTNALTELTRVMLNKDAQALFRVNTYRMARKIDVAPTMVTTEGYAQLLVAEADHLHHSGSSKSATPTTETPKVKAINNVEKGKPKGQGKQGGTPQGQQGSPAVNKPCRNWGTEEGCKAGRTCRFVHDWDKLPDQYSRYFLCAAALNTWPRTVKTPEMPRVEHPRSRQMASPRARARAKGRAKASPKMEPLQRTRTLQSRANKRGPPDKTGKSTAPKTSIKPSPTPSRALHHRRALRHQQLGIQFEGTTVMRPLVVDPTTGMTPEEAELSSASWMPWLQLMLRSPVWSVHQVTPWRSKTSQVWSRRPTITRQMMEKVPGPLKEMKKPIPASMRLGVIERAGEPWEL